MRVTLTFCAVTLAAAGCGPSRLAASTRFTSVPTYASTSGAARGGGPTTVCGPNVPTGTRFRARLDTPIDTANAVPGQPFYATVTQPIEISKGGTIVPAGTQVIGRVYDARKPAPLWRRAPSDRRRGAESPRHVRTDHGARTQRQRAVAAGQLPLSYRGADPNRLDDGVRSREASARRGAAALGTALGAGWWTVA
jgi:hypothetical protein